MRWRVRGWRDVDHRTRLFGLVLQSGGFDLELGYRCYRVAWWSVGTPDKEQQR
jgi:hypothetical protein